MKFRHILDKKVIYSENLGDEYYYDYRIIVQISKNRVVLIEYNDSGSGFIPFSVQSVDKEFISSFFCDYHNQTRKILLQLGSTTTLQEEIDFKNYQEYLDEDISILDFEDIKDYVTMNFDLGPIDYEATEKLCQENIDKVKKQIDKNLGIIGYYEIAVYCLDKLKNIAMPPRNFLCEPLEELHNTQNKEELDNE